MFNRAVGSRRAIAAGFAALLVLVFASCGGDGTSEPTTNPLPVLLSAEPSKLTIGATTQTVTLIGSGFVARSQARWNDADRVTHFQTAQRLTVELLASDVVSPTLGKLTIINGAPGGGTSGQRSIVVGYPTPTVASVSPTSIAIPATQGVVRLTIVGSGFLEYSLVRVGDYYSNPTTWTSTQIGIDVPTYVFTNPGNFPVSVVNPTPGGGTSNSVNFGVNYPVPTITAVSPDSVLTGAAFSLTVNGTGFGSGSVVRWNGSDRPTTYVSANRLTASITSADVASETTAQISVFSPTPGGGSSNVLAFRVREAAPLITDVSPGTITAGSSSTTVTLTGSNFRVGATAQWDGELRSSTRTSSTTMTVTLLATDVATARVGKLTVTNPGASGTSNAVALAVLSPGASMAVARTISLTHVDLVSDSVRGVLYASVPNTGASQYAHMVVRIDPTTGNITGSVNVGSNPAPLAITDDGQYLYVGLTGQSKVVRVALATFTKDIDINLSVDGFFGGTFAEDIVPIPGSPRTIAVSTYYNGLSPRNAGTFLFDDSTRRVSFGPGHTGSNRITRGPNAARIYGYNNETTEFGFRSLLVSADGLHEETVKTGLLSGFASDIEYDAGLVYATSGEVIDVNSMTLAGRTPVGGIVRPDAANARVHFLSNSTIHTYHYTAFTALGEFSDGILGNHTRLVRWGRDGLAAGGGDTIVLLRGGLVAP